MTSHPGQGQPTSHRSRALSFFPLRRKEAFAVERGSCKKIDRKAMMHVQGCCLIYLTYSFFDVLVAVADAFVDSYPLMLTQMIRKGHTAVSRKVVGKNAHATIPQASMGCNHYTVFDTVAVKPSLLRFLSIRKHTVHDLLCHSFKFFGKTVNSKPPTIPFGIVACTFSDNLSRNSCILHS